ncbi:unnamed protein product [Sphagnum balticum]
MKIVSVKINNILSIEDAYVEFDDTGLILVQGWNHDVGRANGAGKTAIFNAITYALYDKLPRKITATEILRRGSKSGFAEVALEVGGDRYVVRRSRPKGVSYYKGSNALSITQEGFEQIIRLNYTQFIISMYAAQGNANRFLSINDSDKKQFLLQLLNLEEFSACKLIADSKVKLLETELATLQSKMSALESKVDAYRESLVDEDAISRLINLANQHIADLAKNLSSVQAVLRPDLSKYQKLEDDIALKKTEFTRIKARREMLHGQHKKLSIKASAPFQGSDRAVILRDIELYKTVSAMYSPTGAQAYILDSVIESFNERIVEYVNLLWSNLTYELKSYKENVKGDVSAKFSEQLIMDGKPISIGSLSGGEFRALSLCVDFSLIDVMERQFGISMSPVILDEPFDGLDASGKALITELLETLAGRRQDLIDKIQELKKSLAAMKPKENTLVPALKLPTVKPLSISSSSGNAVKAKLPGVAPVSGKDPKKMAEQLKNPRPKKAKVEVLKTDKNGQWSLHKFGEGNSV